MTAPRVSVVIPAYREAGRIGDTVRSISTALAGRSFEVLVVDDGSPDETGAEADKAGATVIKLEANRGKGEALAHGLAASRGKILLLLDADLRESAAEGVRLVEPVDAGEADMAVAVFPQVAGHLGGVGAVR